jgi:7-cyano-7-deazaguanine synthase
MEIPTTGVQPNKIPTTYVPGRNIIFLAVASSWAESIGATRVYGGMNAVDYSGYPDCRPEFIAAMNRAIALGTEVGNTEKAIQIITPLIDMTKSQIIKKGMELSVPYQLTWSCYIGGKKACGVCDSCRIRLKGFSDAGLTDPIQYENRR